MPSWMDDDLDDRRVRGLYRTRRRIESAQGARIHFRGRELINFSSNDYLNLAADPRLAKSAAHAARRYGCGAGASPLVSGHLPPLRRLEKDLANWEESEATLVFSSGYAANLAVVSASAGREDAIFSDELNHASLIDGCRLSRAPVHVYRHADANHLKDLLRREGAKARRRLIVTDSVFSMDGDFAPLADLFDLAERFDCLLIADEAHATGVLGEQGRGLFDCRLRIADCGLEETNPESARRTQACNPQSAIRNPQLVVKVGTLSKALGSQGGFVCGSRTLIRWLVNFARPYVFSTALAPPAAAAARRAVRIVQDEPERRRRLVGLADFLRNQHCACGFAPSPSRCQIVSVIVGESRAAVEISRRLEKKGLLVPAIRPPSVPEGTARLRICLTAGHTEDDIARLVESLKQVSTSLDGFAPTSRSR